MKGTSCHCDLVRYRIVEKICASARSLVGPLLDGLEIRSESKSNIHVLTRICQIVSKVSTCVGPNCLCDSRSHGKYLRSRAPGVWKASPPSTLRELGSSPSAQYGMKDTADS